MFRCCRRKKRSDEYPVVHINNREQNKSKKFPSNRISTTKYNIITFLPKNLFEQFRRVTNIYFLTIAIISSIPQISPISPVTTFLPLLFVLAVSAVKDGWEDYRRYKSDVRINSKLYQVLQNKEFVSIKCEDIQVGDIVKVLRDEEIPADIVLLKSSDENGIVFADTASLDGETTLKHYKTRPESKNLKYKQIKRLKGKIEAEVNTQNLNKFKGNLEIENVIDEKVSINEENLLLKGSRLRNTEFCYGSVVYSGKNTKIMLNSNSPPSKWSKTERKINRIVTAIFIIKVLLCAGCSIASGLYENDLADNSYYLHPTPQDRTPTFRAFLTFWSYFTVFSYFIPISLMVSLELAKLVQAMFLVWDVKMINPITKEPMSVNNSNLNDELARAKFIFCDKTGTLTENKMIFDRCSIGNEVYNDARAGQLNDILSVEDDDDLNLHAEQLRIKEFLLILATCNTAIAEVDEEKGYVYQAQSPDEICLCNFARDNNVTLKERKNDIMVVDVRGEDNILEIKHVFDFTSERKRMSIILKRSDGTYVLFSKGADNIMFERIVREGYKRMIKRTEKNLEDFSSQGLRTLIICKKELTEKEFRDFDKKYNEASTLIEGRQEALEKCYDEMEQNLILVGCTAIEDKLQEEVPETIHKFLLANVKVWMLTGDKQSTAINIASTCNLIQPHHRCEIINANNAEDVKTQLTSALESIKKSKEVVLVIDGTSLAFALAHHKSLLFDVCKSCVSVVCSRATPLQKAMVVRLMKKGTNDITLAIGDGANDVSMLREANIGVGILGNEGSQAARCSDYALHRFKDLHRLVCIHGRYNLIRSSSFIQYSFYKNLAMFLVQLWFAYFCMFSGQTLYDDIIMAIFNVVITSLPPLFLGVFERDVDENVLIKYPQSHRQIVTDSGLTYRSFIYWFISALWHSLVIFFVPYSAYVLTGSIHHHGRSIGIWEFGTIASSIGVCIVLLRAALLTQWWNIIVHFGVWISLFGYFMIVLVESQLVTILPYMNHVFEQMFSSATFIFLLFLSIIIALLPDFVGMYITRNYFYDDHHILQEIDPKEINNNVNS